MNKQKTNIKTYQDFNKMIRDMQDYLLENGGSFISADSVQTMNFGWYHADTNALFSIKVRVQREYWKKTHI